MILGIAYLPSIPSVISSEGDVRQAPGFSRVHVSTPEPVVEEPTVTEPLAAADTSADNGEVPIEKSPGLMQLQETQKKLLSNPGVRFFMRVFGNRTVMDDVQKVAQHPNRMLLLYCEIGWLITIFLFKIWLFSGKYGMVRRMLASIAVFILYFGVASFLLPVLVIGEPYSRLLSAVLKGLLVN